MLKTLKSKTPKITQKIKDNLKSKQGSISVPVLSALLFIVIALALCFFNPATQSVLLSLPFQVIKSVLFVIVLMFAAKQDLKELQVSNWYSAALLAIGLIGVGVDNLIGGAVCYSVFFLVAMLTSLGGADVKIAGCCGFVLGTLPCLIALLIGLSISLILETITTIIKKDGIKRVYPLVPYIASGCIVVTILKGIQII